jgi:RimJ/RimL family protein N-acetyltransferase
MIETPSRPFPREVETDRLFLRQFHEHDFEAYLRIVSNPEVRRYFGNSDAPSREEGWRHMAMLAGI